MIKNIEYYITMKTRTERVSLVGAAWWIVRVGPLVGSGDHNKHAWESALTRFSHRRGSRNFWIAATPNDCDRTPRPREIRHIFVFSQRPPYLNDLIMVPKPQGSAIQSATHRPLPPLPKLRVRRPNKPEANPCLGVMSSVLGMLARTPRNCVDSLGRA
jgi:hypothetical protein